MQKDTGMHLRQDRGCNSIEIFPGKATSGMSTDCRYQVCKDKVKKDAPCNKTGNCTRSCYYF